REGFLDEAARFRFELLQVGGSELVGVGAGPLVQRPPGGGRARVCDRSEQSGRVAQGLSRGDGLLLVEPHDAHLSAPPTQGRRLGVGRGVGVELGGTTDRRGSSVPSALTTSAAALSWSMTHSRVPLRTTCSGPCPLVTGILGSSRRKRVL